MMDGSGPWGTVHALLAQLAQADSPRGARLRPCRAGGVLPTSTRPTLNRRTESRQLRLYERSVHTRGKSCSDLGRVLVLNDPLDRWCNTCVIQGDTLFMAGP
jgi:hypothetical protein